MTVLVSFFGIAYVLVMLYFALGFRKIKRERSIAEKQAWQDFTVVIPFRNEAENIYTLVDSLRNTEKSLHVQIRFVFVDDHSEDGSKELLEKLLQGFPFEYSVLSNAGQGKKGALLTGIENAQTDWIVTTDADVTVPKTWLREVGKCIASTNAQLLVMPIALKSDGSLFQDLQRLESAALVGMSAGALKNGIPFSANGANLAFTKKVFEQAGGYKPETQTPSGDDEFLLKRVFALDKNLVEVCFSQNLIVEAAVCRTFRELIQQRTRWASKVDIGALWKVSARQLLVLLPSLFMAVFAFAVIAFLFTSHNLFATGLLLNKWLADFILFLVIRDFFGFSFKWLGVLLIMHFYQVAYMLPVLYSRFFSRFEWKGRSYGA